MYGAVPRERAIGWAFAGAAGNAAATLRGEAAEHHVAVLAALSSAYMKHHARAVHVAEFEMGQFGPPHARGVQGHENRAVERGQSGCDETAHLFLADGRQVESLLRIRRLFYTPVPLQCFHIQEPQRADALVDGLVAESSFPEQVRNVLAYVFGSEVLGRLVEIRGEVADGRQVYARGTFGVITTLEFLEHSFS